jgi:hypothetical protein
LKVRVSGDPDRVMGCHCDFCLKRTGGLYPVVAWFNRDQLLEISGASTVYNGLEVDGVGGAGGQGTSYHFCPTCGSTLYWTFDTIPDTVVDEWAEAMARVVVVAVGNFLDPDFPPPQAHVFPELRPSWLTTHPDAH